MIVKECMTKNVKVASPSTSLHEAAKMMKTGDFGILPVAENDKLVGMISDRDIIVRAVAEGKDPDACAVRECMSRKVLYCFEDQTLDQVTENLGDNQIRRLPVLNRKKRLVGILSLGDIAKSDTKNVPSALRRISRSSKPASDLRM